MGLKGQRDFRHVGQYLYCKQAKSFVNVIEHGTPPIQNYIFLILQQFGTKLCNFTHFKMLFPAMVVDFFLLV
jgi:hypothetical protein